MTDFDAVDIFTDESLIEDPYPYFEHLRSLCPVAPLPARPGAFAVTGYDEAMTVYRDPETFSSINSAIGPFLALPGEPEGDDVSELIELQREQVRELAGGVVDLIMLDPPQHTQERAVLMRLLTPKRLSENEEFMWRHADHYLDEIAPKGECEFIAAYSRPFTYFVIADLLGVPEEVHDLFRRRLDLAEGTVGDVRESGEPAAESAEAGGFAFLGEWFSTFLEDRRREPKNDVLTDIALAKYLDGSTPPIDKITRTAVFLFLAGTETSARLLATCLMVLAENPEIQEQIRADRSLIPNFVEEALRFETPVKTDSRTVRRSTTLAGVELTAGSTVSMFLGAIDRDPRQFECPTEFRVDRPFAQGHLAFGRGVHSCPGAPLARAEARITMNRVLDRMRDIRLSEEHHGPPDARRFSYAPTYVLRGLEHLHLEFTEVDG